MSGIARVEVAELALDCAIVVRGTRVSSAASVSKEMLRRRQNCSWWLSFIPEIDFLFMISPFHPKSAVIQGLFFHPLHYMSKELTTGATGV
jgi:hypothetical protein